VLVTPSERPISCNSSASTGKSAEPGTPANWPRLDLSEESIIKNKTLWSLKFSRTFLSAAAAFAETESPSAELTNTIADLPL
jgi:hypothetical protein